MTELVVAFLLILLNGVFALSELAIVSARKSRLKTMVESGRSGARTALALAEDPGRFLSTVQIGITLVGLVAGAVSGAALGATLADWLRQKGVADWAAEPAGYGLVLAAITYFSVVVGELVPKQLALRDPEGLACRVAPTMALLSRLTTPFVWLLDASSRLVIRLFGAPETPASTVTEEEIKTLVAEAASAGVIEGDERRMISGVLRLGDRSARALMTPRTEIDWIDVAADTETLRAKFASVRHTRLPAAEGSVDSIIGVIEARDVLGALAAESTLDARALVRAAPIVPDTLDALGVIDVLRGAAVPMALVHDEYGHFEGVVTPADVLDAIAGAVLSDQPADELEALQRDDGSWLIDAAMPADEFADLLALKLPERRAYETAAGFALEHLQRLPATGDRFEEQGWRFEIVDLDGRRIDKLLAKRLGPRAEAETAA
ncbi:MAG: HlyC/CorC family transporter [Methylobacteriaceae bacterium]|nr:HlyC/CorC family transporter [Methylobacteriaceae bacterium]